MWRLFSIVGILPSSIAWLFFLVLKVPDMIPEIANYEHLQFPSSLEELKILTNIISKMMSSDIGYYYALVLFSSAYLFKQTFAIPGSVFLNLLAGAIFGLNLGFLLTCFLTACGATCCYSLAKFAGRHVAIR